MIHRTLLFNTVKTDRFRGLREEGLQCPRQQHSCVYAKVSCHRNSYSAKVRNGTLFIPQVHRQRARPYTPHHRHPTAHNSAVERLYTWLYSTFTLLLNATLLNPYRAIVCQPMLQRINPTTNRKSTCNTSTKQCYSCLTAKFFSKTTFLSIAVTNSVWLLKC